jgi:hypothetical protein
MMKKFCKILNCKYLYKFYLILKKFRPPWMDLDVLYYYKVKSKDDIGKPKKGLKM